MAQKLVLEHRLKYIMGRPIYRRRMEADPIGMLLKGEDLVIWRCYRDTKNLLRMPSFGQ
ncbi:MAG: hypothetical protein WDZ28_00690 [Simkaniaceae bacterium]